MDRASSTNDDQPPTIMESTPLLAVPPMNPSPTKWYQIPHYCAFSSSYTESRSDKLFSCSPMVSGLRTLHLPDLELRDAALASSAAIRGEEKIEEGRRRSKSLGDARERYAIDGGIRARMTAWQRDDIVRKAPSGLSLCLENKNGNSLNYGSSDLQEENLNDAKEEQEETETSLRQSQSCTISNLGIESPHPSPRTSPINVHLQHHQQSPKKMEQTTTYQSPLISLLYGLVNTSIILPVLMSFGSIIYHHDFFKPYLSTLMKLTVLSGAVHQITFSTVSSLPFAVGQVQDAGLIFLSAMSRDLVNRLQSRGEENEVILATVCVGLSLGTALLGLALMLVGRFRLASYMQMLPSCVVGGYLVSFLSLC